MMTTVYPCPRHPLWISVPGTDIGTEDFFLQVIGIIWFISVPGTEKITWARINYIRAVPFYKKGTDIIASGGTDIRESLQYLGVISWRFWSLRTEAWASPRAAALRGVAV